MLVTDFNLKQVPFIPFRSQYDPHEKMSLSMLVTDFNLKQVPSIPFRSQYDPHSI